jgi:hypothetical protein
MNGIGPRLDKLIEIMNDWNFKFTSSDRGGDPSGMYLEHYAPNLESELRGVASANQDIANALERIAIVMEGKATDEH